MTGEFLIPFRGRNRSGPIDVNFLWRWGRLYVMDNHRLALWCWWQHWESRPIWRLLHIDRHYDALWSIYNPWPSHSTEEHRRELDQYLSATVTEGADDLALYRWDNYLAAFLSLHADRIKRVVLATAKEGAPPTRGPLDNCGPWDLMREVQFTVSDKEKDPTPWILNIDLDYFVCQIRPEAYVRLHADVFLAELAQIIKKGYEQGIFRVITIAMSPEPAGGWAMADHLLKVLLAPWPETPSLKE
jgi:hypothetical protein